ncbi:SEN1 N terminal-domain-containing protein [Mycena crocata]|nr:SEN1 N terminal-domain-containing protein [Mycena crocata]
MASHHSHSLVDEQLATLRDSPVNNAGASDAVLASIFTYLMSVPPNASDGRLHWFCARTVSTTVAAATFLIRLFAYNSPLVEEWRTKFQACLNACSRCVQGLEEAKATSKNTYFGAFSADILAGFYQSFEAWELSTVLEAIAGQTLAAVSPAIAYRIVSNLTILQDPKILSIIHSELPMIVIDDWPTETLPPGILLLLADEQLAVRQWAERQTSQCKTIPIPRDRFFPSHVKALEDLVEALDPSTHTQTRFPLCKDRDILWLGFWTALKTVPVEYLQTGLIYRIVNGHLHDVGPHFRHVLRCFEYLTRHLGPSFWQEEGPEYPQVIFDSIKENTSFSELLTQPTSPSAQHPLLSWCSIYLSAIEGQAAQAEVIAKIADFLCEELQHERFGNTRPAIMLTAINLFSGLYHQKGFPLSALSKVFDIHAAILVEVAFSSVYDLPAWNTARASACHLVGTTMLHDSHALTRAISTLCHSLAKKIPIDESDIGLTGGPPLWRKTYQTLQPGDGDGMTMIVEVIAQSAHLDCLTPKPFGFKKAKQLGVNRAMHMVWDGLRDAFARYTESSRSSSLLDLLRRPQVVQHVFVLLLSPIADIQLSAQSLVGLAFDVDGRQDCCRALLENHPDAALDGLFKVLTTFTKFAIAVPEACSLAKCLVRYLQDVIDVLCSRPDGLLFSRHFLRPGDDTGPCSRLPALWNSMNQAITVIFKRTPMWANYFENEEMLLWMRDALIYGRDLLAQFRVFETAANSHQDVRDDPGSLSKVGQQMADDLQRVLPELTKWLRLSDEELLYQMFELLQSLLNTFHETRVVPLETSLQKMTKHIHDARKDNTKSRLDSSRLSRLENTLALFMPDEEIVSPKMRDKSQLKQPAASKDSKMLRKMEQPVDRKQVARSSARAPGGHFFTSHDRQQLDGVDSFPSYRRSTAEPSKPRRPSVVPTISVHSSEEHSGSEEEESQNHGTLASLSHMQRSPKIKQAPLPPRQIKRYDAPIEKNPIQQRREKRAQEARKYQRLKPDLSGLYKTLLSWRYHYEGAHPPGPQLQLSHVPTDRFADYSHYRRIFEPLLLLECWAQIVQSKEEIGESYRFKIDTRQFIDDWVDLDMIFDGSVKKDWRLTESDVVLLQQKESSILGKVESYKTPMGRPIQTKIRCVARIDPGLALNTEWQLSQVFSLSTINREYAALLGLAHYDLCPSILRPSLPPIPKLNGEAVKRVMAVHGVNEPQAIAISSCLDTSGFSLIQGPPGTGKTSTIVALVMAFLARRPRRIADPAAKNAKPEAPTGPQILICAPSNAAIDEIAHRIRDSDAFKSKGHNIVRLGAVKSMNANIVDISLDQLVDNKLDLGKDTGAAAELAALRVELEAIKSQRKDKILELDSISDNSVRATLLQDEITRLQARRASLVKRIDEVKDNRIKDSRGLDMSRRAFRLQVLQSAHVICATLSGSGADILQDLEIEMVIIDEASQAIELSTLIPLKYQPKHVSLIGDPNQLPPTNTFLRMFQASRFRYNESLFVRLQKSSPNSVHLLSIQYRMHPTISQLPSALFYQSRLKDGPNMGEKTKQPWHHDPKFGVYRFLDIKSVEEKSGRSIRNITECKIAVALFARLRKAFSSTDFDGKVGAVISMYRAQIVELRRQFVKDFGSDVLQTVDFNTVDGFQGQEKTIVILSCVRSGPGLESVGFLSDVRRMNVALTRAKSSLFILGNAATLSRSNDIWNTIVSDARTRDSLVEVDHSYFSTPSTVPSSTYVRRPSSPAKAKAKAAVVAPPSDLATPRELKAAFDKRAPSVPQSHPPSPPPDPPPPLPPAPRSDLKRKLESDDPSSSKARKPNIKPRPPRPKDTTSIFIPKKKVSI